MVKDYKEIKPDYTVDKFVDGQAPTANDNSFQQMVNFIPGRGQIRTRLGIGELVHTPDTTGTAWNPEGYDPGDNVYVPGDDIDYAIIQSIFPFNTTATIGTNLLSGLVIFSALGSVGQSGKCTVYTPIKKEGLGSLIMTDDTAINTAAGEPNRPWGMRTANNRPIYIPGANGFVRAFMMTYWIFPLYDNHNAEWHFNIGNDCNGGVPSMMCRHFDDDFQVHWMASGGGTARDYQVSSFMVANEWHFISVWHDFASGFSGLYVSNDTYGEKWTANQTTSKPLGNYYISSSTNTFGGRVYWDATAQGYRTDLGQAYHGLWDYVTMWSKPFHLNNTSNVTLSRLMKALAWAT